MQVPRILAKRLRAVVAHRFDAGRPELELRAEAHLALEIVDSGADQRASTPETLVQDVEVDEWLMNLAGRLLDAGLEDLAVEVATRFAETEDEGGPFRMDLPPLLARARRQEVAATQAEANLQAFPEHPWMAVSAAEAYSVIGDPNRAEALYRRAAALAVAAGDPTEIDSVHEHLAGFLTSEGREREAQRALGEAEAWRRDHGWMVASAVPIRSGPKVGRNDPCPCGSGRKYKRCHGA